LTLGEDEEEAERKEEQRDVQLLTLRQRRVEELAEFFLGPKQTWKQVRPI